MQRPGQEPNLKMQNISRQELKKIEKSMKRPQFMGLLNEYMVEISDPKNKNQYDEYLRQMEREGELPKHMKLAKLKPQFCFRTHIISDKNKKHQMKLFINMCSTTYLEKPSCQPAPDQEGKRGFSWQVPHSMGKLRYDQDRHKNPCQVADCAFHPDSFQFAAAYSSFQAMMISIALESAERLLGERKQTLSKDYVILKKLKCKSENGEPALLPIRYIKGKVYNRGEGPAEPERDLEGRQTKLQKQINEQKAEYDREKEQKEKKSKEEDNQMEDQLEEKKPLIEELDKGLQAPKYTSIYTYVTDYTEFIQDPNPGKKKTARKLPSKLSIELKVPRIEGMSEVSQLQINEKKIIMGAGQKYFIDLSFEDLKCKYTLRTNQAKAKYDKKKKTLRIQIPVDQKNIQYIEQEQNEEKQEEKQKNQKEETKIIENQTWKNKVLDVPEQEVGMKFLEQKPESENEEPKKKLIEEIDEDDYVEEMEEKQPNINKDEAQKFSVRQYYNQKKEQKKEEKSNVEKLKHIFQETNKQVIIVVQMMNYQNEDIEYAYHDGELALEWKKGEKKSILHLSIDESRRKEIKKMELIKRVGFYAFTFHKGNEDFWEKQSVHDKTDLYELNQNECLEDKFHSCFQQLVEVKAKQEQEKEMEIRMEKEKEKEKEMEKQKQKQKQMEKKKEARKEVVQNKKMEQIDQEIKDRNENKDEKIEKGQIFGKVPPQFILFNAPFLQALN